MKLYIKELREEKGLTQKELAELMHVSFQTISKWENGVNFPDITHIPRLADIFGVSADIILGLVPLNKDDHSIKYDEIDYWNENRDVIKIWKNLYWNDDYFKFLVKDVWKFSKPIDILDFGCGYGYLGMKFMPLLPEGSSYTGIELDKGQIEEANNHFSKTSFSYHFINEDIYKYQQDKQFDLVVALFVLSYMPHPEQIVAKMKDALKPGGMILLIDANMEVEQAGYYSGLEKQENGLIRPDFIPLWEYEMTHHERDYRMGTKIPFLLKQEGFQDIRARISDQVVIYEPADSNKSNLNDMFRYAYSHEDSYRGGVNYFLNHGHSLQRANDVIEYYNRTSEYFDTEDAIAVKTSGIYFVYAAL